MANVRPQAFPQSVRQPLFNKDAYQAGFPNNEISVNGVALSPVTHRLGQPIPLAQAKNPTPRPGIQIRVDSPYQVVTKREVSRLSI